VAVPATGSNQTAYGSSTNAIYFNPNTPGALVAPVLQSSTPFHLNSQTVTANYTIPASNNCVSGGPITINTGVTVTVSTGSRWVVV